MANGRRVASQLERDVPAMAIHDAIEAALERIMARLRFSRA
jgi:hypothetical protein